jgi:hypothetical protein
MTCGTSPSHSVTFHKSSLQPHHLLPYLTWNKVQEPPSDVSSSVGRLHLKCDGTHADFVFRRNGRVHLNRCGLQFSRLLAAEVCVSAVVMLDTPCSEVVWRVLATHSIRQLPLHFPSRASPYATRFQTHSTFQLDLFYLPTVMSGWLLLHLITCSDTNIHQTWQDSSGRVINSSQRPLPDNTQQSQLHILMPPAGFEPASTESEWPQTYN